MGQHKTPCAECPFSRKTESGHLGLVADSSAPTLPEVYIGQIGGLFFLPCHASTEYCNPAWRRDMNRPQCAGAAIFRSNVGVSEHLPRFLLYLHPDADKVFKTFAEFLAFHKKIPLAEAEAQLAKYPPDWYTICELRKLRDLPPNVAGVAIVPSKVEQLEGELADTKAQLAKAIQWLSKAD